jgi:hypothetical protein
MLLNFPSLYKHLFVCKAHRKRLVILILLPSVMQWIPVNGILSFRTILRHGRAWLSLMLGAAFSCSLEGDGPRSPSAQSRCNRARRAKYLSKVVHRRMAQVLDRTGTDASLAPALSMPPLPQGGTRTRPSNRLHPQQAPAALAFYTAHPSCNRYLEVKVGGNVTGSTTQKGVFARCQIPPHTTLAPYLGTIRGRDVKGPYCLQVRNAENTLVCLDARDVLLDVGYLQTLFPRQRAHTPTPPNYGRCINSLRPDQLDGASYNVTIQPDDMMEGFSWFISRQHGIPAGAEILAPYGDQYWIDWTPPATSFPHLLSPPLKMITRFHLPLRARNFPPTLRGRTGIQHCYCLDTFSRGRD